VRPPFRPESFDADVAAPRRVRNYVMTKPSPTSYFVMT